MNRRLFLVSVLIVLALLVNTYVPAIATHEQASFFGQVKVTNHKVPSKCIAPDRIQICLNRRDVMRFETTDVRLTGEATLVYNSMMTNLPYGGHSRGDFHLENDGGYWEGSWKGSTDAKGNTSFFGVGKGGEGYKGLIIRWQMESSGPSWLDTMSLHGSITREGSVTHKR